MPQPLSEIAARSNDRILVFIPAYNCAPQIGRVLAKLSTVPAGVFEEILVVDNQSTDGTPEAAFAASRSVTNIPVKIVRNHGNYGLGGSHKSAFAYASARGFTHVVVLHGDDQGNILDVVPVLEAQMHHRFDCCLGSRFARRARLKGYAWTRMLGNYVFNALFSLVARRKITDLGSGLNVFNRRTFSDPAVLRYSDDLRFNCYLLLGLVDSGKSFRYFPISWAEEDQISNVKIVSQSINTLKILVQYLFSRRTFRDGEHRAIVRDAYTFNVVGENTAAQSLDSSAATGEMQRTLLMSGLNLIMPMAGRGSRFAKQGIREPKPLVNLEGKPFFWWAVESVRRAATVDRMVFVILEEHARDWALDQCIRGFYPEAQIVAIPDVTTGSAETAAIGVAALNAPGPLVINDCDHAFIAPGLGSAAAALHGSLAGMLMTFRSDSPNYSYLRLDTAGAIIGTVEKQVASPFAIAGCYLFQSAELFQQQYETYVRNCPYPELFISGIYNQLIEDGHQLDKIVIDEHFAFGTPEEYAHIRPGLAARLSHWR